MYDRMIVQAEIASSLGVGPSRATTGSPDGPVDVLLAGDAGVGKTRLLRARGRIEVDAGWQVYTGRCLDLGAGGLPYLPFSEVIGQLSTERPEVVAEVARHARLAMDDTTALHASVRAGKEASAVGAPDETAFHYQQALGILRNGGDLGPHGIDLARVVQCAVVALMASGDPERAIAVIGEQLEVLPDIDPMAVSDRAVASSLAPARG